MEGAGDDVASCAGGYRTSTVACIMSSVDQAIPPPSPSCLALFRAGGPAPSSYLDLPLAGTVLACVAARCEWLNR